MKLWHILLLLTVLLPGSVLPARPVQADTLAGAPLFFAETGHTLGYNFRQFYEQRGGLAIFGLPLTEVFIEDGRPVQYFERARLEWHAQLMQVQAGHLGRWAAEEQMHLPGFQPVSEAEAPADAFFFEETGHTLRNAFRDFWQRNGGLATFGYPLSEEFAEQSAQDGQTYVVQYFERARFEWHPEQVPGFQVQLGHLGRQYLAAHPAPQWATQPVASTEQAWGLVRPTRITVPRIGVDASVSMTGFAFGTWDVPRHTIAHYWPVSAVPGTAGNIVLAGHVGYPDTLFNYLPAIEEGDEVFVTVNGSEHRYIVEQKLTLLPYDTWVMNPTPGETLTLITCVPIGVYSHRLVVRATPAPQ